MGQSVSGDALICCLAALGLLVGLFGRRMLDAVEQRTLPATGIDDGARTLLRVLGLAALVALAFNVAKLIGWDPVDLPTFLLSSRALADGADLYDPEVLTRYADAGAPDRTIFPYLYLPLYALLLRPLSLLPVPTATAFFLIGNAVLWVLQVWICYRLADPPEPLRTPLWTLCLVLLATFFPATWTMHQGSPSLVVAVLVFGGLLLEREGRSRSAGLLLALAVLIKTAPVLVLTYLALRQRYRVLFYALLSVAVLLLLSVAMVGPELHIRWLTELVPTVGRGASPVPWFQPMCHIENQSLTGAMCRCFGEGWPPLAGVTLAISLSVFTATTAVLVMRRRSSAGEVDRLEISLVVVCLMLTSSITWFHHLTLMLLPLLVLALEAARPGRLRPLFLAGAVGVGAVVGLDYLNDPLPAVGPSWALHSARFLALATCFLLLLVAGARNLRGSGAARSTGQA